ncbi:60S ribosomal protein L23 [Punctularia strigosozonata HHB-11173 SS5]|uniref:60S ribosomal protein L23 n=1 Tax=Punctularia strigosozonata (strain HHB-11173) TaxID=741275 RepID=UPI00044184AB|nr:60S ribosomal protein L23 [Punctularia strigosozonata HHB-11173 SS5]EIN11021.1 60S ribosomal protein L23 [Punctularia strigosozonata HHB-11173 SS5]
MSQAIGNTALAYARVWHHADATDRVLGKFAIRIAHVLMGKHKPIYDPGVDCGDYVVVTNAKKIKVSGLKAEQKVYRHHTMHPGGLKEIPYKAMMDKKPDEIIRRAVAGMLPKNKLRDRRLERLRIFSDEDMGPFKANIIKRWEDGTLPARQTTQTASAPSSTTLPTA